MNKKFRYNSLVKKEKKELITLRLSPSNIKKLRSIEFYNNFIDDMLSEYFDIEEIYLGDFEISKEVVEPSEEV